jgi:hypothetical protein
MSIRSLGLGDVAKTLAASMPLQNIGDRGLFALGFDESANDRQDLPTCKSPPADAKLIQSGVDLENLGRSNGRQRPKCPLTGRSGHQRSARNTRISVELNNPGLRSEERPPFLLKNGCDDISIEYSVAPSKPFEFVKRMFSVGVRGLVALFN